MALPTIEEMFANATASLNEAYRALGDAGDWLRSDWQPLDAELTTEQADKRTRMRKAITAAKQAINDGKSRHND
jgi:hypothetical protein